MMATWLTYRLPNKKMFHLTPRQGSRELRELRGKRGETRKTRETHQTPQTILNSQFPIPNSPSIACLKKY
jgi:hypothetical protein